MKNIFIGLGVVLLLFLAYLVIDLVRGSSNDYYETHILKHTLQSEYTDQFIEKLEVIERHRNEKEDVLSVYKYYNHFNLYTWNLTPYSGVNISKVQEEVVAEIEMDQWAVYLELYSGEHPLISFSSVRDFEASDQLYLLTENDKYERRLVNGLLLAYTSLNFKNIALSGAFETREIIIHSSLKIEDGILLIRKAIDGITIYLMYSPDNTRIPPLDDLVNGIKLSPLGVE